MNDLSAAAAGEIIILSGALYEKALAVLVSGIVVQRSHR
jgi:hypothetical protein